MSTEIKNLPADHRQRRLIEEELDKTMLVEAAAGTGKTTCMTRRMVELLASGRCRIEELAAVTFTRKAAAELRARFCVELEHQLIEAEGTRRTRIGEAIHHMERCFIGTIHSFCVQLLSERPVEAGINLAFEEIDEEQDRLFRRQAWDEYVAHLFSSGDPILEELYELGMEVTDLKDAFFVLADYPDVDRWPGPPVDLPDLRPSIQELRRYIKHIRRLSPNLPQDHGNDRLIPKYQFIDRMVQFANLNRPVDLMKVLECFRHEAKPVKKLWNRIGSDPIEEYKRWCVFKEKHALPLIDRWYEYRYPAVMRIIQPALNLYNRIRWQDGKLNYQDLLLKSADLLRENPHIRSYFRRRITHLLVDEFQDTDPIQAEVMMLLTSDDPNQIDWKLCRPVPGALFVVGDPKQSIYRFRRADIETYGQVRKIIESTGGLIVGLTTNFRTIGPVVDWVNGVFDTVFPSEATRYAPANRSMEVGRKPCGHMELAGVKRLCVSKSKRNMWTTADEADRIARTIRSAIDAKMIVPDSSNGDTRAVHAGDFLIVTRYTKHLSVYAEKLEENRIPHIVTGGTALNESEELLMLSILLGSIINPDNPILLVGVLRSELFGISDAALYAFKQSGGCFSYRSSIPEVLDKTVANPLRDAFEKLGRYSNWVISMPVVAAIERIVCDLGLATRALLRPGSDENAGSLFKGIELLRRFSSHADTPDQVLEELNQLVGESGHLDRRYDGISLRAEDQPRTRVMNLHKAKGLEAPVVFLADPTGDFSHAVKIHIDRSGDRVDGYVELSMREGAFGNRVLARPAGWAQRQEEEQRFEEAEKDRLRYVAATRAGLGLIVTQLKTGSNRSNPWAFFEPFLQETPQLYDPGVSHLGVHPIQEITEEQLIQTRSTLSKQWAGMIRSTYETTAATTMTLAGLEGINSGAENGAQWGEAIHRLLEGILRQTDVDLDALARSVLSNQGFVEDRTDEAMEHINNVRGSEIWHRVLASPRRLVEVPLEQLLAHDPQAKPRIVRAIIDLVFQEEESWVIVDYKTTADPDRRFPELIEHYRPQLDLYGQLWEQALGQRVAEKGLLFTQTGQYVVLSDPDMAG